MPGRKLEFGVALACLQACLLSTTALGQTLTPERLEPTKTTGVLERARPEYDAKGINLGSFMLSPSLNITGTSDDNIFATQLAPTDDFIVASQAGLRLSSNWSHHSFSLTAASNYSDYTRNSNETNFNWSGAGTLGLDVTKHLGVDFNGGYFVEHESREDSSAPLNTLKPIELHHTDLGASIHADLYPVALSVSTTHSQISYQNGELSNGTIVNQSARDRTVWAVTGKADYAVSADTSIFVEATQTRYEYDEQPPVVLINRDSTTDQVMVGAQFDVTNLMRGEVAVGAFQERFSDSSQSKLTGLAVDGRVEWLATQLTTVVLDVSRQTAASDLAGSSAFVGSAASIEVDHELMRNVILNGHFAYDIEDFGGIDRNDHRYVAGAGAVWLVNRNASVNLSYDHKDRTSRGLARGDDYTKNVVTLALQLKL